MAVAKFFEASHANTATGGLAALHAQVGPGILPVYARVDVNECQTDVNLTVDRDFCAESQ